MELNTVTASSMTRIHQFSDEKSSVEKQNSKKNEQSTLSSAETPDSKGCLSYITLPFRKVWEGVSSFASWIINTLFCCCASKKLDIDKELANINAIRADIDSLGQDGADKKAIVGKIRDAVNQLQDRGAFRKFIMVDLAYTDAMKDAVKKNVQLEEDNNEAKHAYVAKFLDESKNADKFGKAADKILASKDNFDALDGYLKDYAEKLTADKEKAEAAK